MNAFFNAFFPVVLAAALLSATIATMPADAAPRKKKTAVPPSASVAQPPTDRFLACDVRVRDYLREGGAVIRVTKIEVDDARLQLNIHHEYGEAGRSSRKYLRGDSEEEMRKNLRGILDEFAAAAKAAAAGRAWYVIAARKVMPDLREGSGENTSPWTAIVLADFEGKCRPITFYQSIDRSKLDPEVSKKLDE
ncbi:MULTISPECIES: hypothetical protein [unclassified Bradyrhizobium]|uniref:hypothetical protein n=1 Tax=unclassified Bradyrhizobium TaxID=2631580 RepID=UPI002FF1435C